MATPSLFRALPAARRVALLTRLAAERKQARALFIQRLVNRGGGFRAVTLMQWPPAKLAAEFMRLNAQTAEDEVDFLQALYVDLEPAIQTTFLQVAGVKADAAVIDETLEAPYAEAAAVKRAAEAVREAYGEDGAHYLRVIARYNAAAWPGIDEIVASM